MFLRKYIAQSFKLTLFYRVLSALKVLIKTRSLKIAYFIIFPELDTRAHFLNYLPPVLVVECTTRCNLKCAMCNQNYWPEKRKDLSFIDFKKIVDQVPQALNIWILGLGENLMNKDFLKMVSYLKSKNIRVCFIDNFTLLTEGVARELVELGVDQIWFSIERTTKELFEKTREGASFDGVMRNIRSLAELKKRSGQGKPEIALSCTLSTESFFEMPLLLDLAIDLGAEEINFCQECSFGGRRVQFDRELFLKKLKEVSKKAANYKIKLTTEIHPISIADCQFPWVPFITVDGDVIPVCQYFRDALRLTKFGNIFERNFREIWDSGKYREYRALARRGKQSFVCAQCQES